MARVWNDRSQYGNMIKNVLASQIKNYLKEPDRAKKTKIAQSIAYLIQTLNSLITSFEETRITSIAGKIANVIVEEDVVKEITRDQVVNKSKKECYAQWLKVDIIEQKKCDVITAEAIFSKMNDLGLELCTYSREGLAIERFALVRGYVTEEEVANAEKARRQKEKEMEERERKLEGL